MTGRPAQPRHRNRRGSALILVLIAIVVLAVLSTGAMLGAMQEFRAGRAALVEQRAIALAEFGLNSQLANWSSARNQLAVGGIEQRNAVLGEGDTARVTIMRLNATTFWITSLGRVSVGTGRLESQREANLLVRLSAPSIIPAAAIVTYGSIDVKGSANITGRNTPPPGWTDCAPFGTRDTFAIAFGDKATIQKPATQAVNGTFKDPAARDTMTYLRFGSETWQSLVAKASVTASGTVGPSPQGSATTCTPSSSNWGEPNRGSGSVAGCRDYFPIIHAPGNLRLTNGRGQGILLVDGNLQIAGNFVFAGLIVVMDDVRITGSPEIYGSIMMRNRQNNTQFSAGNPGINFSRCTVGRALNAQAAPARTRQRAWAQLY